MRTLPTLCLALCLACATAREGPWQAPSVTAPHGVAGYRSGHALFYVVPLARGVVLVDTGYEKDGEALLRAVGGRPVLAVLVTHAHVDHVSGVHLLGPVPVYVGEGDVPLLEGTAFSAGLLPLLGQKLMSRPAPPQVVKGVRDGDVIDVDGARFRAVAVPGHTRGSTAWIHRDILFSGDALLGDDDGVGMAPTVFSDDDAAARDSALRLRGQPCSVMLDGHAGLTQRPMEKLRWFIDEARLGR